METIFMNKKTSKTSEPHKFVLKLSQILEIRSSNKHIDLQKLSFYYTWKNIRQQHKNYKLKIIAPTWNASLVCLIVFIQCHIFKIISSI